jgi:uncharacterized protein (DUF885 family)
VMDAHRIVEDAWEELRRSPLVQQQLGIVPARLPSISPEEAQRRSGVGRSLLKRLDALRSATLPHDLELTLRLVRFRAGVWAREADWYWLVVDPLGEGFFGLFLPTAYCGGYLLHTLHDRFAAFRFVEAGDADRYLALIADYARLIDEFSARTLGQAQRGIRMPAVQLRQARELLSHFKSGARRALALEDARTRGISSRRLSEEVAHRVEQAVEPAFDRALSALSDDYLAQAPEGVGMSQYAGGEEVYAQLVTLHTTLALSPEEVHAEGHRRMAEIETSMELIRSERGYRRDKAGFLAQMKRDVRWRAGTVAGVQGVFQRYMDRLNVRFDECFPLRPKAPCRTAPLPQALEDSMTFGYYDAPQKGRAEGIYFFNAKNLTSQSLFNLGALIYHELLPGHHLHFSTQQENETLHPFRTFSSVNAYNEGWAEYAATLAGEMGLYEVPEERYGRLVMDAFLTSRLVVDTGMNALGWSLEQAREYMREHSGMAEAEILTETVRYSCDLPAQALAYKLGDTKIFALRERMREALGPTFTMKDFHAAVLGTGAVPLPEIEWHLEHEIERRKARHPSDQPGVDLGGRASPA